LQQATAVQRVHGKSSGLGMLRTLGSTVGCGNTPAVASAFNPWLKLEETTLDKLRALQYLVAAAEGASLSAAARQHGVSVAAVAKLIGALEADIGLQLLERRAQGVAPTAAGSAYIDAGRTALAQLQEAQERAAASASQVQGTVVLAIQPTVAQEIVAPALPRFCALYPEVELDIRYFMRMADLQDHAVDAIIVLGWPQQVEHLVHRSLGASTFIVVASPGYWAAHGMPRHPSELEHHNCLCIRSNTGAVMDLWRFRRGEDTVQVSARGSIVVDNVHRDVVLSLAEAGVGVARVLDWQQRYGRGIPRGRLVPALTEWFDEMVPPVNLLYPPSVRRVPRVRLFLDWVTQLFAEVERERQRPLPASPMPRWVMARKARASATR
jgi:DNA-binding transcriptional LysR family regulator